MQENQAGVLVQVLTFSVPHWLISRASSFFQVFFYFEQPFFPGAESCFWPLNMLNTHWPLSSGPSKNKIWRPTCSGTECYLQLDDRKAVIHARFINSPARPQAPHLSTANSSHTAKEQMGHQFCLLKRNRAFLTGVKGQWLQRCLGSSRGWRWRSQSYPISWGFILSTFPLPPFSSEHLLFFEVQFKECFLLQDSVIHPSNA